MLGDLDMMFHGPSVKDGLTLGAITEDPREDMISEFTVRPHEIRTERSSAQLLGHTAVSDKVPRPSKERVLLARGVVKYGTFMEIREMRLVAVIRNEGSRVVTCAWDGDIVRFLHVVSGPNR